AGYLAAATLLFVLPMLLAAWAGWRDPGFILHLLDAASVQEFDEMYGPGDGAIGRERDAGSDWRMFGFYIMNNVGISFQCFAAGIFAGVGSAFFLVFNGLFAGVVGGYLVARGHGENFLSFVVTHAAFELTAIVLAGAAGLRLGHAWLAPGRHGRVQALRLAAREAVVVIYGVIGLLLVAAAVEAFWSSTRWVTPAVKYGVGAVCWALVIAYLAWQGRPRAGEKVRDAG
ncbi:MAG TPA: stage II sporulation protein M, partial [Ramlibacter sp.]